MAMPPLPRPAANTSANLLMSETWSCLVRPVWQECYGKLHPSKVSSYC